MSFNTCWGKFIIIITSFNFNNLYWLNYTIFLNYMISDGNILRLLYFFFFILSSWSFIPRPSFNHTSLLQLILKIKWNEFLYVPAASQVPRERTIFSNPLSRTYSEFLNAWGGGGRSKVTTLSPYFALVFWFLHIFQFYFAILCICLHFLSVKKIDNVKPKSPSNVPLQSFLPLSCLSCFYTVFSFSFLFC